MVIKKFTEDEPISYTDHIKPVVNIPTEVSSVLDPADIIKIQQQALQEYRASKAALNESVADVATKDPAALEFAGEMSKRVLTLMEIAVELGLSSPDEINADETKLKKIGISQEAINTRGADFLQELKQKTIKTSLISESKIPVEKGNVTESGFVGFSPQAIQNATEGNLRERMYIPYKTTHSFTSKLLANEKNVELINQKLQEKGEAWRLDKAAIDEFRAKGANKYGGIYAYGAYATSREGSRKTQTKEFREEYANLNPTITELTEKARIPLSQREILTQSGDITTKHAPDKRVEWQPGEAWSGIEDAREHQSVKAADETGDVMLTGISGTTDSILTLGHMIGMFEGDSATKKEAMRTGMVACLGWMVDAHDHTAHEIQTGAKSFGLEYTPGPDSYKQIKPGDGNFLQSLKAAQQARGFKMPDEYLTADHVKELAKEYVKEKTTSDIDSEVLKQKQQAMKEATQDLRKDEITQHSVEQDENETSLKKSKLY